MGRVSTTIPARGGLKAVKSSGSAQTVWVSTTIPARGGLKGSSINVSWNDGPTVSTTIPARGGLKGKQQKAQGKPQ